MSLFRNYDRHGHGPGLELFETILFYHIDDKSVPLLMDERIPNLPNVTVYLRKTPNPFLSQACTSINEEMCVISVQYNTW